MPAPGWRGMQERGWETRLGIDINEGKDALNTSDATEGDDVYALSENAFERDQLIALCKTNVDVLAAVAMPTVFKYNFPPVLLAAWQILVDGANSQTKLFPQIALGIPRGHAKTTLIKLFILHCILFSQKRFILVLCDTAKNAENIIADISDMLSEPNITALFGNWTIGLEINRQDLKKFAYRGRPIVMGAIGAGGSVRGLNLKHMRPDVMIFEDVQTKECSESAVQSDALERWMIGTAMKAKSPSGCTFIFVGNMYPGPNSILKKLKSNPAWIKFISGAILADGSALWPELHSVEDLVSELNNDMNMGHPEIFFSEVLNDTEAGINTKIDLNNIKPWAYTDLDFPQGKFLVIDPATDKAKADEVTIGYFEVYDGKPAFRQLIEGHLSPGNTIRQALSLALKHNVRLIAVESTSYQYSLLYWFTEICRQLGLTGIEAVSIYSGSNSKNSRITAMLSSLSAGDIVLHEDVRHQVIHQIANWNPIKRDNNDGILDVLTYATKVIELYGYAIHTDASMQLSDINSARVLENNSAF